MKNFLLLFFIALPFILLANSPAKEIETLRQTELDFSKLCGEKGMKESFLFYADKDVIKPNEGRFPIFGRDSLSAFFERKPKETFKLEWYPVKVEVSKSADLGFTFGNWILTTLEGEKSYGNYVTFWKKQEDGTWKFIFDSGNSTPDPTAKK